MDRSSSLVRSALTVALLAAMAAQAGAATLRVQCEQRGTQRARISVDGGGLVNGTQVSAQVVSGGNAAAARPQTVVGGQAEFDFDSNPNDIAAGANAIAATFIVGGTVTGKIVNAAGATLIADTVACRVRSN